jgi:hypothetical protein
MTPLYLEVELYFKKVECMRIKLLYVKKVAAIVHLVLDNDADSFKHVDMPVGVVVEGVRQGLEEFYPAIKGFVAASSPGFEFAKTLLSTSFGRDNFA